jgi:hypothetical protein
MWKNKLQILFILLSFPVLLFAQNNKASISLSKDTIQLGDPLEMTLLIPAESLENCVFPEFPKDSVAEGVFVLDKNPVIIDENKKLVSRTYSISAYAPGDFVIPPQSVVCDPEKDSLVFISDSVGFTARAVFVLDTLPRDTVYADNSGVVFFGRSNFEAEIEQQIPDSVRQSLPEDSLNMLKDQIRQSMISQFTGQVFRGSGLRSEKDILQMVQASQKQLFIVTDKSIRESHRIPGAFDTVFVQELDSVIREQALFTSYEIEDIVDEYHKTSFNMKELWYYFWKFLKANWWWILAILIVGAGLLYYFLFYRKGKKVFNGKEKVQEPAHIIAFRELDRIRNEKLWLRNQIKSFYTDLTDTMRHYLENRYGLSAMEKTSAEILESLDETDYLDEDLRLKLREVLERSDFVKFARSMPLPDENERSLNAIYVIVERTRLIPEESEEEQTAENDEEVEQINE